MEMWDFHNRQGDFPTVLTVSRAEEGEALEDADRGNE
jgi:hypothetical protein